MILNKTYFQSGRYKLPNLNEPEPNLVLQMDLETLIETSEEDVLSKTFGIPMYEDFMTYIVDGDIDTLAPENYQKLFKGAKYSKDGKDYYCQSNTDTYVSLIKFLVDNKDQYPLLPENYKGISLKVKNSFGL